jgi:hypothetical protein
MKIGKGVSRTAKRMQLDVVAIGFWAGLSPVELFFSIVEP